MESFFTEMLLLNSSFLLINYAKRETIVLDTDYLKLLLAFNVIWLVSVLLFHRKFHPDALRRWRGGTYHCLKSTVFIVYAVSFVVVFLGLSGFSRLHIYGTCLLFFSVEALFLFIYRVSLGKQDLKVVTATSEIEVDTLEKSHVSPFLFLNDFFMITVAFGLVNVLKRGSWALPPEYEKILLILYGVWLLAAYVTHKFETRNFRSLAYTLEPCLKSFLLMVATMSVVIYAFRLFYYSRLQVFGTILVLFIFEVIYFSLYFNDVQDQRNGDDSEEMQKLKDLFKQKELPMAVETEKTAGAREKSMKEIMGTKFLKDYPHIFEFMDNSVDLSVISPDQSVVTSTHQTYNIKILDDDSKKLLINLNKINDIRYLNQYFLHVHRKLVNGGYFVVMAITYGTTYDRFTRKYPRYFAQLLYFFHFMRVRVIPKLPVLKKLYFYITKGRNRAISKAEVLGRLAFCGFKILNVSEDENSLFCLACKAKSPAVDTSPSYGPLVRLRKTGLGGRIIYVYKFRTMHPYSEYLQDYIYEQNNLKEGGKMNGDFRVTEWGKYMRKMWLDELPMIYNWLRGDLNLVSFRPLSEQYLSMYNQELQELRKRVKPGLIPPFYADMPTTLDEICESERRYIGAYLKKPIRTQWLYFWKAFNNIVLKGARSN